MELSRRLNEWLSAKWGVQTRDIPPSVVHLVDISRMPEESRKMFQEKGRTANYNAANGLITVFITEPGEVNGLRVHHSLVHEMIHAISFLSFQKDGQGRKAFTKSTKKDDTSVDFKFRRVGLSYEKSEAVEDQDENGFLAVNEALTEELARAFDMANGFRGVSGLASDLKTRESMRRDFSDAEISSFEFKDTGKKDEKSGKKLWTIKTKFYAYQEERALLNNILDGLKRHDPKTFPTDHAALKPFIRAAFEGSLLPLARLIDKIYGKGSFAKLAEWDIEKDGTKFLGTRGSTDSVI